VDWDVRDLVLLGRRGGVALVIGTGHMRIQGMTCF
jgi:hypothetical protein